MEKDFLDKNDLMIEDVMAVARYGAQVELSREAEARIHRTRSLIAKWVHENRVIYGITTGFGAMCHVTISENDARKLQKNIIIVER